MKDPSTISTFERANSAVIAGVPLQELVGGGRYSYRFQESGRALESFLLLNPITYDDAPVALDLQRMLLVGLRCLGDVAAVKTRHACSGGLDLVRLISVRLGKRGCIPGARASRAAFKSRRVLEALQIVCRF